MTDTQTSSRTGHAYGRFDFIITHPTFCSNLKRSEQAKRKVEAMLLGDSCKNALNVILTFLCVKE